MNRPSGIESMDLSKTPFIVIWEVTQACDLSCVHCRASAQPQRHPLELTTSEGERLIDEVAAMAVPVFILTGGDPLKRPDLYHLIEYASRRGVRVSLSPSPTPLITREVIAEFKRMGVARMAISIDGSCAEAHDAFRRVPGSFDCSVRAVKWAHEVGLPVQINTSIARRNLGELERIGRLLETLDIVLWSVFFLVPVGRGRTEELISAEEFETAFAKLYEVESRASFGVKTTEAMHYRRYVRQRQAAERKQGLKASKENGAARTNGRPVTKVADTVGRYPRGINDAKGFVFISHIGEVMPSGFLPVSAGNVRRQPLSRIYRESPLFVALRDTKRLEGKCGVCEFREICGGSRARAYALTGDYFAEEPCCIYQPAEARTAG
jgi:radical SAM protein